MDNGGAFVEKVILLLLTALISGLGIPYVLKVVDERRLRQGKLIESQAKLLDDLTHTLWTWRYLAKSVAYYGARGESERFQAAKKQYEDIVWGLLNEFRTEISRSRRLVSERAFRDLNALYDYVVHKLDHEISNLMPKKMEDAHDGWHELAWVFTEEVSTKLDQALDDLAAELRLKVRT